MLNVGDQIYTPRFCTVTIKAVYEDRSKAYEDGFTEPTHYKQDPEYDILGKSLDMYHMHFAAVRKAAR
jgi:hypothetical protein